MAMVLHERTSDVKGVGKWDRGTGRYVPASGGSRSRLPLYDDKNYGRYPGFVGIDEHLSNDIYTMAALYHLLGGSPLVIEGVTSIFVSLVREQAVARLNAQKEE